MNGSARRKRQLKCNSVFELVRELVRWGLETNFVKDVLFDINLNTVRRSRYKR